MTIDTNLLVRAGMSPLNARQAAGRLNTAIDAAAVSVARSAAAVIPSNRPVRTTATATKAFTAGVDAALTGFVAQSVPALRSAGVAADGAVAGTLAALAQVVRTVPGVVALDLGADLAVAGGTSGTSVSASLNPVLASALRQTISDSVRALRPVLPLSRATLQTVGAGVRQVVDAAAVAVERIVVATTDLTVTVVGGTAATVASVGAVADGAVTALGGVVAAADAVLANLSDVNISAPVDAGLGVSAH
ncbi:MAG TPA: hypothetical protein VHL53_10420 [Acidimicrobiia bacterium]|nr:hypothetical protein [Acidimicrobiia bacterium]